MTLTQTVMIYFAVFGSVKVKAQFEQTTFFISPSKNVSNADSAFFARSLTDCASGSKNIYNRTTATYRKLDKTCHVSTATAAVITNIADNNVVTIFMYQEQNLANQFGTKFVTGFMNNGIFNDGIPCLMIVSSVPGPTNVLVNIPYLNISQEQHVVNGHLYLQYSNNLMPALASIVTGNGVEVTSDQPIALYSFNQVSGSTDGTLELPTNLLGQEYIIDTHNSTMWGTGQIVVVAVDSFTQVSLTYPNGSSETIMLNKYQTYQRRAVGSESLAGTMISANASVAVHAGHMCANVPDHSAVYCDVLVSTVPPTDTFGRIFIIPYQRPRSNHSIGVVAPESDTEVTIMDIFGTPLEIVQMNMQDSIFRSYYSSEIISITSTKDILVTQYGHGSWGTYGDPSLTVIPATDQYGSRYTFAVPTIFDDPSIVSVVLETNFDSAGLILNGFPANITESGTVVVPSVGSFYVLYLEVNKNVTHVLCHADPRARFGAWLYARNMFEEYTSVLGYNL